MIQFKRVDSSNVAFKMLVKQLDAYLAVIDGKDHAFYHQFNKTAHYKFVLLAYYHENLVACGAIVPVDNSIIEVKRMYTLPDFRGKGIASKLLLELENWAGELSYNACVLETGKRMPDAIALYEKNGYKIIPNYGQYVGIDNSVCFKKDLI